MTRRRIPWADHCPATTSTTGRKTALRPWAAALWLLAWQGAALALDQPLLLPSPLAALTRLAQLAATAAFWQAMAWSALRVLGGFFLACAGGLVLAAAAGCRRWVAELLYPPVAAVKAVPVASFIILALVWVNARSLPLLISFLMVFPPVYLGVLEGIHRTDPALLEMARVFQMSPLRTLRGIYVPQVLPYFRTAASLGLGLCWKAGIAAEVIGLPAGSLGERLYTAKVYFQTADLFAWTAAVVAVSLVFERLVLAGLDALARKEGG